MHECDFCYREGGAGGIMVGGRTVEVDLALSQDDARNLASGGRSTAAGKDNRNLYLVMPIGIL